MAVRSPASALLAACLLAAGCSLHADAPAAATRVTVAYGVGPAGDERADIDMRACPSDASCDVVRVPGNAPPAWQLRATYRLSCDPPGGSYRDAGAACAALDTLVRRNDEARKVGCVCPARSGLLGRVRGVVAGERITLRPSYCCPPRWEPRVIAVLMPGRM